MTNIQLKKNSVRFQGFRRVWLKYSFLRDLVPPDWMIGARRFKISERSRSRRSKCPRTLKIRPRRCVGLSGKTIPVTRLLQYICQNVAVFLGITQFFSLYYFLFKAPFCISLSTYSWTPADITIRYLLLRCDAIPVFVQIADR